MIEARNDFRRREVVAAIPGPPALLARRGVAILANMLPPVASMVFIVLSLEPVGKRKALLDTVNT